MLFCTIKEIFLVLGEFSASIYSVSGSDYEVSYLCINNIYCYLLIILENVGCINRSINSAIFVLLGCTKHAYKK